MILNDKDVGMKKPMFFLCILSFLLFCVSPWGAAQTATEARPVAFMVFVGDDLSISSWFQTEVVGEVQDLGGYSARQVSATQYPETLNFPADVPPDPTYLGAAPFVLTGEYYVDVDDLQHFQLWLWTSESGALIYTDEMVFEDQEEAEGYLPPMVRWIFSHVLAERYTTVAGVQPVGGGEEGIGEEEPADDEPSLNPNRRLYLGVRGAASFNTYSALVSGGYEAGTSQGFSADGAIVADFRIFRFLGVQAEAIFNFDTFKVAKITNTTSTTSVRSTDRFSAMSLMFPLVVKVPVDIGNYTVAPFVGIYYAMPLGNLRVKPEGSVGTNGSYAYNINPPLGLLLGVDASVALGPGELFVDLRYSRDIGMTVAEGGYGIQYVRSRIGLSLGYKFLIWNGRNK
jgi:hypothetical protein